MKRIFMMLTLGCFVFLPLAVESASGHQAAASQQNTCAMAAHGCCNHSQAATDTSAAASTVQDQAAAPAARPASCCGEKCACCAAKDGGEMKCDMQGMEMPGMKMDAFGRNMDAAAKPDMKCGKGDCAKCAKTSTDGSSGK